MKKLDAKFFSNVKVRKDNHNSHSEDQPLILSEAVLSGEKTISEVGVMIKYGEPLRELMKLFGEEVEPGMSYEHIHKVIYDNLDNLKELINQQREVKKVTKVKIFYDLLLPNLEKEINRFLNNDSIELVDIKYTFTDKDESAMIIYKVEDKS